MVKPRLHKQPPNSICSAQISKDRSCVYGTAAATTRWFDGGVGEDAAKERDAVPAKGKKRRLAARERAAAKESKADH